MDTKTDRKSGKLPPDYLGAFLDTPLDACCFLSVLHKLSSHHNQVDDSAAIAQRFAY
ncbi:MAG TPA: hypothetical protein V6D43_26500 [Candidatus Sericytochromatia bacterium]